MRRKLLIFAFFVVFMFLGIMALEEGKPSHRDPRIYPILETYMPYTFF